MNELDRLWQGIPEQDNLHLPPAWVLVYYRLAFDNDTSTRTTDVTDEEITDAMGIGGYGRAASRLTWT